MKKSIIFAFVIFFITLGWLISGQIGSITAQDEDINKNLANSKNKILNDNVQKNIVKIDTKEFHAIKAISKAEIMVFTKGPRGGKEYENDTFRLEENLI